MKIYFGTINTSINITEKILNIPLINGIKIIISNYLKDYIIENENNKIFIMNDKNNILSCDYYTEKTYIIDFINFNLYPQDILFLSGNINIEYGIYGNNIINITNELFEKCKNNIIKFNKDYIDYNKIKGDPIPNVVKNIYFTNKIDNNTSIISEYSTTHYYNILDNIIRETNEIEKKDILNDIKKELIFKNGDSESEIYEQHLLINGIEGNENILMVGGNVLINSIITGKILKNNNMLIIEYDKEIIEEIIENQNINNMNFNIEIGALSKKKYYVMNIIY